MDLRRGGLLLRGPVTWGGEGGERGGRRRRRRREDARRESGRGWRSRTHLSGRVGGNAISTSQRRGPCRSFTFLPLQPRESAGRARRTWSDRVDGSRVRVPDGRGVGDVVVLVARRKGLDPRKVGVHRTERDEGSWPRKGPASSLRRPAPKGPGFWTQLATALYVFSFSTSTLCFLFSAASGFGVPCAHPLVAGWFFSAFLS